MKFESNEISMLEIDGTWYFELYAVGMALGQIVTAKGKIYPNKKRIDENVKNAEIKPVLHNAKPYITESQVYDLMLETRTEKCRAFRKWLTNEVLPTLRTTGEYKMNQPRQPYEYFDKTYNKEPVLTLEDAAYLTGLKSSTIDTFLRKHCLSREDYYLLNESSLCRFKNENPKLRRNIPKIIVITKSGFKMLCDSYGIKIDEPKQFAVKPAFEQLALPDNSEDDTEKMLKQIKLAKEKTAAVNALLEKFAEYVAYKNGNTMEKTIYDYYVPAYKRVLSSFGIKLDS